MPLDRNLSRWLNGLGGLTAVGIVGAMGFLAWKQSQSSEPLPKSPRLENLRSLKTKAAQALARKDVAGAEKYYLQAIAASPRDVMTHKTLGDLYLQDGKRKDAWRQYQALEAALGDGRLDNGSRVWLADLEWEFGNPKKAEELCRKQITDDWVKPVPTGAALVSRAHVFITETGGEMVLPERLGHLRRAVAVWPKSVDGHVSLAHLLWDTGEKSEALRELASAQKQLRPDDAAGAVYLAFMMARTGKRDESGRLADRAVKAGAANDPRIASGLAHVFATLGQNDRALAMIGNAIHKAKSPDADLLCNFAGVYARLGRRSEALALLDQADKIALGGAKARIFDMRKELTSALKG